MNMTVILVLLLFWMHHTDTSGKTVSYTTYSTCLVFLQVEATDADKGENAELVYSLVTSPSAPESFFSIDPVSGQLTTLKVRQPVAR